jgi:hypothetical protein
MNLKKFLIGFLFFCSVMALFSQTQEFPKTMYVTATSGLRQRLTPSTTGKVVGTFLYCEPIMVREKSKNTVTIDGITGYWYKVDCDIIFEGKYVEYSYVFGGYVSDKLPSDAPVTKFEGYWEGDSQNEGISYLFSGNTFIFSSFHGEYQRKGTFTFTETTIVFNSFYEVAWHSEEGLKKINSTNTHTYSISDKILKVSKQPNSSEVFTLEKK